MKIYLKPEIKFTEFSSEDIITTSGLRTSLTSGNGILTDIKELNDAKFHY